MESWESVIEQVIDDKLAFKKSDNTVFFERFPSKVIERVTDGNRFQSYLFYHFYFRMKTKTLLFVTLILYDDSFYYLDI